MGAVSILGSVTCRYQGFGLGEHCKDGRNGSVRALCSERDLVGKMSFLFFLCRVYCSDVFASDFGVTFEIWLSYRYLPGTSVTRQSKVFHAVSMLVPSICRKILKAILDAMENHNHRGVSQLSTAIRHLVIFFLWVWLYTFFSSKAQSLLVCVSNKDTWAKSATLPSHQVTLCKFPVGQVHVMEPWAFWAQAFLFAVYRC